MSLDAESIRKEIKSVWEKYQSDSKLLAEQLAFIESGISIGSTLIGEDGEEFVVNEIFMREGVSGKNSVKGDMTVKGKRLYMEELAPHSIYWRHKNEN